MPAYVAVPGNFTSNRIARAAILAAMNLNAYFDHEKLDVYTGSFGDFRSNLSLNH